MECDPASAFGFGEDFVMQVFLAWFGIIPGQLEQICHVEAALTFAFSHPRIVLRDLGWRPV
jgi:hypothetical protein